MCVKTVSKYYNVSHLLGRNDPWNIIAVKYCNWQTVEGVEGKEVAAVTAQKRMTLAECRVECEFAGIAIKRL